MVVGLKDSNKGYLDYSTTMAAYITTQLALQPFDINSFFASDEAKNLNTTITSFKRVDESGAIIEVNPEPTDQVTKFNQAGSYGPTSGSETISQDVIISAAGVTLQNLTITGNLIIDEAVGDGEVSLNNVTVSGELRVRGGGKNSIHINGGNYSQILVEQAPDGGVRIVATGLDGVPVVLSENAAGETLILEGSFTSVTVNAADAVIKTQGQTSIKALDVGAAAQNTAIDLGSTTTVATLAIASPAKVTGTGTISKAEIASDNVSFETAPKDYTVDPGVVVPPVIPTPEPPKPQPQPGGGNPPPAKINLSLATPATVTTAKTYDGTTTANITGQPAVTGIVASDDVTVTATATYNNKNAGNNKDITITYSLSGTNANKYNPPAATTVTGEITQKPLSSATTAITKEYDGTSMASVTIRIPDISLKPVVRNAIDNKTLGFDTTAVYQDNNSETSNVGSGYTIAYTYKLSGTAAHNFSLADAASDGSITGTTTGGSITAKKLTVSVADLGLQTEKTYDGNASTNVNGKIITGDSGLTGIVGKEKVSATVSCNYDSPAAGDRSITTTFGLSGDDSGNYCIDSLISNGKIKPIQLEVDNTKLPAIAATRKYDATTDVYLDGTSTKLSDYPPGC